jgi:hypothetical protein
MIGFILGVVIAIFAECADWIYAIISYDGFVSKLRIFIYWLPVNISIAFLGGTVGTFIQADTNEACSSIIAIIIIVIEFSIALILEKAGFCLKPVWEEWNREKLRRYSRNIYFIALGMALIPYLFAPHIMGCDLSWLQISALAVVIALILYIVSRNYYRIWDYIHDRECADISSRLDLIITSYCLRPIATSPLYVDDKPNILVLLSTSSEDLTYSLRANHDMFNQITRFNPICYNNEVLPGLTDGIIPSRQIKVLAQDVQKRLLERVGKIRSLVDLLVSDDPVANEAYVFVERAFDKSIADQFMQKRLDLKKP